MKPAGYKPTGERCTCRCHSQTGVKHIVACCRPNRPVTAAPPQDGTVQQIGNCIRRKPTTAT